LYNWYKINNPTLEIAACLASSMDEEARHAVIFNVGFLIFHRNPHISLRY